MTSIRRAPDLVLVAAIAGGCGVSALVPDAQAAQAPLGAALGLCGLGYALTCALWAPRRPTGAETLLLSLALSIAGMIVIALVLDLAGIALERRTLIIATIGVTSVCVVVAWLRRPRAATVEPRVRDALLMATVPVAVLIAALIVLDRPIANDALAGYTQLWATRGPGDTVNIGLRSAEQRPTRYLLRLHVGERPPVTRRVRLASGESWQRQLEARPAGRRAPVRAVLFRGDQTDRPYRTVSLAP